ncbi:MAG TPA: anti-sigma factor [Alphaproteobacteria bacterium]|jgi:anti-sigma factor RsiW|nr:anti-sigma factor [Alphaproteobacteria bacterium]
MTQRIDHAEAKALMQASLDGELDAMSQLRFDAHLADCPACTAEYARLKALSVAVRTQATRYVAPAELRAALAKALPLDVQDPPKPSNVVPLRRWFRPAGAGFAVGAALAASLAVMIDTRNADDMLATSIVTAHVRALQPGHLTDVQISDQHQVKPWFDGKIDFAPPVKELSDQGFDLVGGRLDYIDGREAAVIVYRRKLHMIDLFVTHASHGGGHPDSLPAAHATPSGYNVVRWSDNGQDYWAISDLNRNELGDFAKAWLGR